MAVHTVRSDTQINWSASGIDRVLQNVVNILNTYKYEVAYDRVFGISTDNVDLPTDKSIQEVVSETYDLIEKYEPRAQVVDVEVFVEAGTLVRKVVLQIE